MDPKTAQNGDIAEFAATHIGSIPFEEYTKELLAAWGNIGESNESQKSYITELYKSLRAILDGAVESASARKADIENLVNRKTENVANLKAELILAIDPVQANGPEYTVAESGLSLIERLSALESLEMKLITVRQQWVTLLTGKRDRALSMCKQLGMPFDEEKREVAPLNPARVEAYDTYLEFLSQTQAERKEQVAESVANIKQYWKILESTPTTVLEKSIADDSCDLGVHIEVIEALQQMKTDLNVEYQNREAETAELGAEIQHLWNLLQIDNKFQQYFSEKNGGIGLRAVEACRDERQRLLIKKEKLLPRIIEHERAKIDKLFVQASCDIENQHKLFSEYHHPPEQQNEDYLATLKDYTAKLERRFENLQPILTRVERRSALVEERTQYEALVSDPNRLTSRSRGLSHLKENEMRIRVEKKLPKLESTLTDMITKWQTDNEAVLIIDGKPFLETMVAEQAEHETVVEQRRQNRTEALLLKKQEENAQTGGWKKKAPRPSMNRTKSFRSHGGLENTGSSVKC